MDGSLEWLPLVLPNSLEEKFPTGIGIGLC